jgi:hypothetical protein
METEKLYHYNGDLWRLSTSDDSTGLRVERMASTKGADFPYSKVHIHLGTLLYSPKKSIVDQKQSGFFAIYHSTVKEVSLLFIIAL